MTPPHLGVLGGTALIFFAYLGFEEIANLAEEARQPARDLPRAIMLAVAISTVLYILVAAASVTLLEPARLAASPSPLAEAMYAGAPAFAGALAGVALFATANTALITMMASSRLLFAMARGGHAPAKLSQTLARRRTPAFAILFIVVGSLACLSIGSVGLAGSVASLLALVTFAAVNAALVRLRFTHPDTPRPFRVPLSLGRVPVPVMLGLVVVLLLVAEFELPVYGITGILILLALVVQAIPWQRTPTPDSAAR